MKSFDKNIVGKKNANASLMLYSIFFKMRWVSYKSWKDGIIKGVTFLKI